MLSRSVARATTMLPKRTPMSVSAADFGRALAATVGDGLIDLPPVRTMTGVSDTDSPFVGGQRRHFTNGRYPDRTNTLINFLEQGFEYPVEFLGQYVGTQGPGLAIRIPFLHTLKKVNMMEQCLRIEPEQAYTSDNVEVTLGGNLFAQCVDAKKGVYGASRPGYALLQYAQGVMRTEVGKRTLDQLFQSRSDINEAVVEQMRDGVDQWGHVVKRFEITDLRPTDTEVERALHKQASAQREKTETILRAEAEKRRVENEAEAQLFEQQKKADAYAYYQEKVGDGDKLRVEKQAEGEANRIRMIREQLAKEHGLVAAGLGVSESYISAFGKMAGDSNTIVVPADVSNVAGFATAGAEILKKVTKSV